MKANPCKNCQSEWHTKMACPLLPKRTLKTYSPMNKIGRVGKETAKAVARWKKAQKPNHEGYYLCYMCQKWVPYLQAEHVKGRARHPGLRTSMDNLMATCEECNARKGSKEYEETL